VKLVCPQCKAKLIEVPKGLVCENNHFFDLKNGVIHLLEENYKSKLYSFLEGFERYRADNNLLLSKEEIQTLPQGGKDRGMWGLRERDLKLIQQLIDNRKQLKILDIGAWNNWLSHHLAKDHQVVSIDYFKHPQDGLESCNYFNEEWTNIVMNIEQVEVIEEKFDLIIVNRCLPYISNINQYLIKLNNLLASQGCILILGITLTKDISRIKDGLANLYQVLDEEYKTKPFKEIKGYIDTNDILMLKKHCFTIHHVKGLAFKNGINQYTNKAVYKYAIYRK